MGCDQASDGAVTVELGGLGGDQASAAIAPPWTEEVSISPRMEGEDTQVERREMAWRGGKTSVEHKQYHCILNIFF